MQLQQSIATITFPLAFASWALLCCGDGGDTVPSPADNPDQESGEVTGDIISSPSRLRYKTLSELAEALSAARGDRRKGVVAHLMNAGRGDAPKLHSFLHQTTPVPASDFKSVLRSLGAAVPDRHGRFKGTARVQDLDWLVALLAVKPDRLSPGLSKALDQCVLSVALIRALAATRHHDAPVSLTRFGFRHRGAFRDECGSQIRAMGIYAVPGLLRAKALKDPQAFKMVRYAKYQMDRMDFNRADRCLRKAPPDLRAEILHAYGEIRDPTAVAAVLQQTDASESKVRQAARWAILRYVSGRRPRVKKRKLKLAGGRETQKARLLYLTYRQLATHALATTLAKETSRGQPLADVKRALISEHEPRYLAEKLFARFDRRRKRAGRKEVQAALALGKKGAIDRALVSFDRILAAAPDHPSREEMSPHYYTNGVRLMQAGRLKDAYLHLSKAIHLTPTAKFVDEARARCLLAESLMDREMPALHREWKLRRALDLSPGLADARLALKRIHNKQRQRLFIAGGMGGGVVLSLLLGIALLWRRFSSKP